MANSVPTLTGLTTPVTFLENTVNGAAQIIDADVTFTDPDNNFSGGTLTVGNLLAQDTVAIRNQGTSVGQIGVSGGNVTFGGILIGSFAGGAGSTLTVTFNAAATAAGIEALIENLTYANSSDTPTASRSLDLKVTDAAGFAAIAPIALAQQNGAANPFNTLDVGTDSTPSFADLDGDGDLDAIVGGNAGTLRYFENTGSAIAPTFTERTGAANPFNTFDVGGYSTPSFADLDGDGDLDAIVGSDDDTLHYFENTGSATAPAFTERTGAANPLDGINVGSDSAPFFADLDGDGDLDTIVGETLGNLNYFQNTGSATAPAFTEQTGPANPFNGVDVGSYSFPSFADLDGDGDLDAMVGKQDGNSSYFENTGSAIAPAFVERTGAVNPFNGLNVVANSTPTFADLDGDGHLDAAVGAQDGTLHYFRNTTPHQPAPDFAQQTGAANPFNGVDVGGVSKPSFADLDGDGDLDAVAGEDDGTLNYFENIGSATAPAFTERTGTDNPFNGVDVFEDSAPSFADLDGDGDLDAVIGERYGILHYFENTGSATAPAFTEQTGPANPFNGVDVGDFSKPSFGDLDGDGDLDALVGVPNGTLHYFQNTGSAVAPAFTERTGIANPFNGVDVGGYSTPSFADLDDDGDLDVIVGDADQGTLHYFENTGSALATAFTERTGAANPFNGVVVGRDPAPSFADLDGDGDLDAVVGEGDGNLNYFENTGAGFTLVVDVTAQNDAATITGDITGSVTEAGGFNNGTPTVTGDLDSTDPDGSDDSWSAVAAGTPSTYGTYELTAAGVWTYALDNNNAAVQELNGIATLQDTFVAVSGDGTMQQVTITINAQNDTPALANVDANAAYTENAAAIALDTAPLIVVSDVDNANLASAMVAITTGFVAGDVLSASTASTNITANYNSLTGMLMLGGADTLANYQQVLDSVTFASTSDNPGTARTLTWTITDSDSLAGPSQTTIIAVTPVDDAPVAQDDSYTLAVDAPLNVAAPGVLANDADPDSAITAQLVSGPANAANFVFNADGSFQYMPASTFFGVDTFIYRASDGGLNSADVIVSIDVTRPFSTVSTTDADGNTTFTTTDAQGNQPWSSQSSSFDNMGQQTGATVNYRDGTVQSAAFDTTGQPWSQQNFIFDAQGQLTDVSVSYDDGSVQGAHYDTTGQPWSHQNFILNAQGQLTDVSVSYDDGSVQGTHYDTTGQSWSQQNFVTNPQGQVTDSSVFYDDGSIQSAQYDPMNQQPWSQQNFAFDPQGQLVGSSTLFDLV